MKVKSMIYNVIKNTNLITIDNTIVSLRQRKMLKISYKIIFFTKLKISASQKKFKNNNVPDYLLIIPAQMGNCRSYLYFYL